MIFVGGHLHGHDIHVQATEQGTATPQMPTVYTALAQRQQADGVALAPEHWALSTITMHIANPVTRQPEASYTVPVYLHQSLGDPKIPAPQKLNLIFDAVVSNWVRRTGTKTTSTSTPEPNGTTNTTSWAQCTGCTGHDAQPIPFETLTARAEWVRHHIDTTGHRVLFPEPHPNTSTIETKEHADGD